MQKLISKLKNIRSKFTIIISLLIFGLYTSCEPEYPVDIVDNGENEYAVKLYGKVISADSLKPIFGIKVSLENLETYDFKTLITDSAGQYSTSQNVIQWDKFSIKVEDIDSLQNGWFHNINTSFTISGRDVTSRKRENNFTLIRK